MYYSYRIKQEFCEVREVVSILRNKIKNTEILNYIIDKIYYANENDNIIYISYNKVELFDKTDGSTFTLEINDSENTITTFLTCWNNHHREKYLLKFYPDTIIVTFTEDTDISSTFPGAPSTNSHKSKTTIYHHNAVIYIKDATYHTTSSLTSIKGHSTLSETYIYNHQAVRKTTISNDITSYNEDISYEFADTFEHAPWENTKKDPITLPTFIESNENTFNNFCLTQTNSNPHTNQILKKI